MQIIEFTEGSLRFLETVPEQIGAGSFVWIYLDRDDFAAQLPKLQTAAQRLGGSPLLDVHVSDLQNALHPSHYDYTSIYDMVIFRRLATPVEMLAEAQQEAAVTAYHSQGLPKLPSKKQPPIIRRIHSKAASPICITYGEGCTILHQQFTGSYAHDCRGLSEYAYDTPT